MHTAFYIESFFPKPTGATHSAYLLAKSLRQRGVEVSFLVTELGQGLSKGGVYDGFKVRSFMVGSPGKLRRIIEFARLVFHVVGEKPKVDIVHIHGGTYVSLFIAWFMSAVCRKKTLLKITLNGWDTPDGVRRSKYGSLANFFYLRLSAVVAMTSGQTRICRRWGYKGILASIPNGVDCDRFHIVSNEDKRQLRRILEIPESSKVLCYGGYLGYIKGTDVLFRVWDMLLKDFPDLFLLCVGNYADSLNSREKLAAYLAENGIDPCLVNFPSVRTLGFVSDMERYFQMSDVFVFPSRQEGLGTVQLEAMACGLPCVVNDLPGISSDIFPDDSVGFRVAGNRVEEYARICADLLRDPEKRRKIGTAARQRVVDHFSAEYVAGRYVALYKELLGSTS